MCLVTQSCPTVCKSMNCSLPGCSVHGDSSGKNTGVGCHDHLQGIFPTQGLKPGLPHCRQILYCLSHQWRGRILKWVAYPFSSGFFDPGIQSESPALQADSLPAEQPGEPDNGILTPNSTEIRLEKRKLNVSTSTAVPSIRLSCLIPHSHVTCLIYVDPFQFTCIFQAGR